MSTQLFLGFVLLAFMAVACSDSESPPFSGMFRLHNKTLQEEFEKRLIDANIEFRVDDENRVRFAFEHSARVQEIAFDMMDSAETPFSQIMRYPNPEFTVLLIGMLEKDKVPHEVIDSHGELSVKLYGEHEKLWKPIEREVSEMHYEAALKVMKDGDP